jgi:transcriptional regulator with XRE-family HTH domain
VTTIERAAARAHRRADRVYRELADEFRAARLAAGVSQEHVARAAGISRPRYTKVEAAQVPTLSIHDASRIAAVLGLDLSVRVYPGSGPLRDAAHRSLLAGVLAHIGPPCQARTKVPLPAAADRHEQRAWDAVIACPARRTAMELEMRLRDGQAVERRLALKRRDDPTEGFILLVADTHGNRRVLAETPDLFADLPRLGPRRLFAMLEAGAPPLAALAVV